MSVKCFTIGLLNYAPSQIFSPVSMYVQKSSVMRHILTSLSACVMHNWNASQLKQEDQQEQLLKVRTEMLAVKIQ